MTHGNHPFGAILVDQNRNVLIEAENGYMPAHDGTAHAERLLATEACTTLSADVLRRATLYSSAEPCAMCAGAIYWAGIGRVVYGLSEHRLRGVTGNHPENPTLDLPCRDVFKSGQRPTEVVGPLLEDEAEALHARRLEEIAARAAANRPNGNGAAGSSRRHRFTWRKIRRLELHRDAGVDGQLGAAVVAHRRARRCRPALAL